MRRRPDDLAAVRLLGLRLDDPAAALQEDDPCALAYELDGQGDPGCAGPDDADVVLRPIDGHAPLSVEEVLDHN